MIMPALLGLAAMQSMGAASPGEAASKYPCYGKTKEWRAAIELGSREPELVVSGVVTTPTGSNWNVLTLGQTPWDLPVRQIVELEIRGMSDLVTNAVTTETVMGRFRLPPHFGGQPGGGLVVIRCNGKEVGRAWAAGNPHKR